MKYLPFLVLFGSALHAQVVGGTIAGSITDATGAIVPRAQVLVRNENTGTERRLTANDAGEFSAPSLPAGTYTVTVQAQGFGELRRSGVALNVGQAVRLSLALQVSDVAQEVTVSGEASTVDLTTQQTSGLVNERQVKELPLNGRSYDQLLTLNPGIVNYTSQRSVPSARRTPPWVTCLPRRAAVRRTTCFC